MLWRKCSARNLYKRSVNWFTVNWLPLPCKETSELRWNWPWGIAWTVQTLTDSECRSSCDRYNQRNQSSATTSPTLGFLHSSQGQITGTTFLWPVLVLMQCPTHSPICTSAGRWPVWRPRWRRWSPCSRSASTFNLTSSGPLDRKWRRPCQKSQMGHVRQRPPGSLDQSTTHTAWFVWTSSPTPCSTSVVTCAFVTAVVGNSCPVTPTALCAELQSRTLFALIGVILTE